MNIQDIDKNFQLDNSVRKDGMIQYTIPHKNFDLYGVYYNPEDNRFWRMDKAVTEQIHANVTMLAQHTAGGRLRFSTDSNKLDLAVEYETLWAVPHMTLTGSSGFMLLEELEDGQTKLVQMFAPWPGQKDGYTLTATLNGGKMKNYILWFPLYNQVTKLVIGLEENATVASGRKYRDIKPILYYGSSITQGAAASRPDNCYQALISKWNNIDFINLGFSGHAKGEDEMVDYLTTFDCSLFVCDYDHNAPDAEHLKKTHYRLYERYRKVRPDTPILFLTSPSDRFEKEPERRKVIRQTYEKAKKLGDNDVYFIDGKNLFGKIDRVNCTVDGVHPTDLGFYRIAKKIYKKIMEIDELFK